MPEDLEKATDPFTSAFCNDTSQEDVFSLTVYHPSLWPNISRYQPVLFHARVTKNNLPQKSLRDQFIKYAKILCPSLS